MKLLVFCPHFAPDIAPTGEVMTSIAKALADLGHELHIVTALPWYRDHAVDEGWRGRPWRTEKTSWGRITRLHPFPTNKSNIPARAVAFAGFTGMATLFGLLKRDRPDVVMVMSPPLPLGIAGWLAAASRRRPFVFNVQDVFPDVAVELGVIANPVVIAVASWLERFLYKRSSAVTVLSEDLRDNVVRKLRGARSERVRVIPNFVDTERVKPSERENSYRAEFGLSGKTVVLYAGNVGMSQSLDLVVEAARRNQSREDVVFVINGGGSALTGLKDSAEGLTNLKFIGMQPRERLSEVLAAGDIHLVPLKRGLARSSVPSKLYSILASARPVLASVDAGTEVETTIERAAAGVAVAPEDVDAFCDALDKMLAAPSELAAMGES
ncbi:MAG TPA: glycosyltransferase family 4 protein, partial [Microthrixaceae bacterium]|nr:glycosyltransferase family 4 protein [Microthrixaceae bacterium]